MRRILKLSITSVFFLIFTLGLIALISFDNHNVSAEEYIVLPENEELLAFEQGIIEINNSKEQLELFEARANSTIFDTELRSTGEDFTLHRLIVSGNVKDTYGAIKDISYQTLHVLVYDSVESTRDAYNSLKEDTSLIVSIDGITDIEGYAETDYNYSNSKYTYPSTNYRNWALQSIDVAGYWKYLADNNANQEVVVAVLDSGINTSHPLFQNRLLRTSNNKIVGFSYFESEYDYSYSNLAFDSSDTNKYSFEDDLGHGSHVAGIICSLTPENVKILPIKICDDHGSSSDSLYMSAYLKVLNDYSNRYNIVSTNLSFRYGPKRDESSKNLFNRECYTPLMAKGILSTTSAGNTSEEMNYTDLKAIVVSALRKSGDQYVFESNYSNRGAFVDIAAPGSDIYSVKIASSNGPCSDYISKNGTSMAAPQVAAMIALLYLDPSMPYTTLKNQYTADTIEQTLYENALDYGDPGKDKYYGHGMAYLKYFGIEENATLSFYKNGTRITNTQTAVLFSSSVNISVECSDPSYDIYYTTNYKLPTYSNSQLYSAPITVTTDVVSYAIGLKVVNNRIVDRTDMYKITVKKDTSGSILTITSSVGSAGGTITPLGAVEVEKYASQTFNFAPSSSYYRIKNIVIDGTESSPTNLDSSGGSSYTFSNVTSSHTIVVNFETNSNTISSYAGEHGSISPSGSVMYVGNVSQTYNFYPDVGYHVSRIRVDGVTLTGAEFTNAVQNGYTFNNINTAHTISVEFEINVYTITSLSDSNGSISPVGDTQLEHGASQTYTFTPNTNYRVSAVSIDGVALTGSELSYAINSRTYTFDNVTSNHTISVAYVYNVFSITASAGTGGKITPSGNVNVQNGSDRQFTFTPNTGYRVSEIVVDGVSLTGNALTNAINNGYTFVGVSSNHTISVKFAIQSFTIVASAGAHGSISPSGNVSSIYGGSRRFTLTPDEGYQVSKILVDGAEITGTNFNNAVNSGYQFTGITENHTISVEFATRTYTITAAAGSNGSISPVGGVVIEHQGSKTFTFLANTGYHVSRILVDNTPLNNDDMMQAILNGYTFSNVTSNHTINVLFAINTYTISPSVNGNGTISPNTPQTIDYGQNKLFTFTPNDGFLVSAIYVDDIALTGDDLTNAIAYGYTFVSVDADHSIRVVFDIKTYVINASSGDHGSITPSGDISVSHGADKLFEFTADTGYHVSRVIIDGIALSAEALTNAISNGYRFENVSSGHVIYIEFAINQYTITATAGNGGSIAPSGEIIVSHGDSQAFTFSADTGYKVSSITINGSVLLGSDLTNAINNGYTFTNVTGNNTINVRFTHIVYAISTSTNNGGEIHLSSNSVEHGGSVEITFVPNEGYRVSEITINGTQLTGSALSNAIANGYTLTNVTADCSIYAGFELSSYTITATAEGNGTITPSGVATVSHGGQQTYSIRANLGYLIERLIIDGEALTTGNLATYTFTNVTSNHTIVAEFATGNVGYKVRHWKETLDPDGATYIYDKYYILASEETLPGLTDHNTDATAKNYTGFSSLPIEQKIITPTGDTVVDVYYNRNSYSLTLNTSTGISSVIGAGSYVFGQEVTIDAEVLEGYDFVSWNGGNSLLADPTRHNITFTMPSRAITLTATANIKTYTITLVQANHGTISTNKSNVSHGGDVTISFVANNRYHVAKIIINGEELDGTNQYTITNIKTNYEISAIFKLNEYSITLNVHSNGHVHCDDELTGIPSGESRTFTIVPNEGYELDYVKVDDSVVSVVNNQFTLNNIESDTIVEVAFKEVEEVEPEYITLTCEARGGGTITPSGAVQVVKGESKVITFSADTGYHLDAVYIDNISLTKTELLDAIENGYTFTNLSSNHSIIALYIKNTYKIVTSHTEFGNIELSNAEPEHGDNVVITLIPEEGYHVESLIIDDVDIGQVATYTLLRVSAEHTISAVFGVDQYTITLNNGDHGSVDYSYPLEDIEYGETRIFEVFPDEGYELDYVRVNGNTILVDHNMFAIRDINADVTIDIAYRELIVEYNYITIIATSGSNGIISPSGAIQLSKGSSQIYSFTPSKGYHISSVVVDGEDVTIASTYKFIDLTTDHTIRVDFEINTYEVSIINGQHGRVFYNGQITNIVEGNSRTFTIMADSGYEIDKVIVNGIETLVENGVFTLTNITANTTIEISYQEQQMVEEVDETTPAPTTNNTGLYIGLGIGGASVLGAVVYFIIRRRKNGF